MILIRNINYVAAVIFIILWAVGYFAHLAGDSIHFLFVGALILILFNVIQDDQNDHLQNQNY